MKENITPSPETISLPLESPPTKSADDIEEISISEPTKAPSPTSPESPATPDVATPEIGFESLPILPVVHAAHVDSESATNSDLPPEEELTVAEKLLSIYDIRSRKSRNIVLLVAASSTLILPMTDTIYLPALPVIQTDLNANPSLVAASVSVYMFMVGVFSLIWGPFSDRFGRRLTAIPPLIGFIVATVICIIAKDIALLVVFRGIQGAFISALVAAGQSAVADAFSMESRGSAIGLFMVPVLVGPIIGPLIGGALAQALGWRATFIALEVLAAPILVMLFFGLPETHHYYAVKRLRKKDSAKADSIKEEITKPVFIAPHRPLVLLLNPTDALHACVCLTTFASMFVSLTELPNILATDYGMTADIVGVCYLPVGAGLLVSSVLGGKFSDVSAKWYPKALESRLIVSTIVAFASPVGLILYGWAFEYHTSLAGPLIGSFLIGVGQGVYMPGLSSYLSGKNQKEAAAVLSAVICLNFCAAGVFISVAELLVKALGVGYLFTLLAGVTFLCVFFSGLQVILRIRKASGNSSSISV